MKLPPLLEPFLGLEPISRLSGAPCPRQGDVLNAESVAAAIPGHDAVVLTWALAHRRPPGARYRQDCERDAGRWRAPSCALSTLARETAVRSLTSSGSM